MFLFGSRRIVAVFFLFIFSVQLFWPAVTYALTTGPSQPEMQKFEAAGTGDLVDMFTGDLKYNLPLLDVGGYPVNLSYQSGTGMEEEASWVGMGWTLNPGALTRQMRGLPDDFDGQATQRDLIEKDYDRKEFRKVGGNFVAKNTLLGIEVGNPQLKLSVYKDNYYGIGASIGASLNFNLSKAGKSDLTASLGLDFNSDIRDGLDINPSFSLSRAIDHLDSEGSGSASYSVGPNYNTRAGLKSIAISYNNQVRIDKDSKIRNMSGSAVTYFGQTYTPSIKTNTSNTSFSFNGDFGSKITAWYKGVGGGGFYYAEKVKDKNVKVPAYGYLNYLKGRKDVDALLDFNREKEAPFIPSAPSIPIPVATPDLYLATGQAGSMQFRPQFAGNYVVFDKQYQNLGVDANGGFTFGAGNIFLGGVRLDASATTTRTGKWVNGNNYLNSAEAEFETGLTRERPVSFKQSGELLINNPGYWSQLGGDRAAKTILLPGMNTGLGLTGRTGSYALPDEGLKKTTPDKKVNNFQYLNNLQAKNQGLNKAEQATLQQTDLYRKAHHMSEVTITDGNGQRMVYGIPVYNTYQEEVSFSVAAPTGNAEKIARRTGLISYTVDPGNNDKPLYKYGRDELYSRERMPGYATGFLLTGVLSPDYVDVTGDGITDDDLGGAVKFSYDRHTKNYKWRAPFQANMANYNEGLLSDPKDDKANYVYGEKELWYLKTIESKTMIAVFHTQDRLDALGVISRHGGLDNQTTQRKLEKIVLYSKADYVKNGATNAVPIKTVHFEYDYSLYPGSPNSTAPGQGRLTLKKVWFTFGKNNRGASNPYVFSYKADPINVGTIGNLPQPDPTFTGDPLDKELNELYTERQVDRWGTYKQSWYNRLLGSGNGTSAMNNSEYPYALQKISPPSGVAEADWSALIDRMAERYQLYQVETPSGGIITVDYESDDYAFVQDRRAMNMYFLKGIENADQSTGLVNANRIAIHLPVPVANYQEFKELYLRNADGTYLNKIYYKFYTDMDNYSSQAKAKHWEYVYGYAEILDEGSTASGNTVFLSLKKRNGYNPIAKGAWQMLRTELPQYAYDGYDNSNVGSDLVAAITSIFQAVKNIGAELKSFDKRAANRGYANQVDLSRSMVRLYVPRKTTSASATPVNRKNGGGIRVRKVQISDQWSEMTDAAAGETRSYGQVYDYAIRDKDGNYLMSSGVAAYEPMLGNEENPFREPIPFTEQVHWQRDRYHYIEKPYCESYFPGPSIGYSRVSVIPFGADYDGSGNPVRHTGEIIHEFYTARDFPTLVEELSLDKREYQNSLILKLFTSRSVRKVATSQGFTVVMNDMHGKAKKLSYLNKAGDLVSSTEYFYHVQDQDAARKELKSKVPVLFFTGSISEEILGEDIDFTTDVRESDSQTYGLSTGTYAGAFFLGIIGMGYTTFIPLPISSHTRYASISLVKAIHRTGIVTKVVTTQNGSTLEAENLLWDPLTGQVLLTRNQTEYDKATYQFNFPAHMVAEYKSMGPVSQYLGTLFPNIATNSNGVITSITPLSQYSYIHPGDELIHVSDGNMPRGWIIKGPNASSNNPDFRLVDRNGDFIQASGSWLLVRSGRRNLMSASVGSIVLMEDPRVGLQLQIDVSKRILDAKALTYKQEWPIPVNQEWAENPDQCTNMREDCFRYFMIHALAKTVAGAGTNNIRRAFFSEENDGTTTGNVHLVMNEAGCSEFASADGQSVLPYYWETSLHTTPQSGGGIDYVVSPGDQIKMGDYQLNITSVHPDFLTLANSQLTDEALRNELSGHVGGQTAFIYKYCIVKTGACAYEFRRTDNCSTVGSGLQVFPECGTYPECNYTSLLSFTLDYSGPPTMTCVDPEGRRINPYQKGILGNWRPLQSYVYTTSRNQDAGISSQVAGTDIRNNGYYNQFTNFWNWEQGNLKAQVDPLQNYPASDLKSRWVWSKQAVYYDQMGNETESVDALGRYGSALYGYQQTLATAVAANSRRNEIAFDGFEDYDFDLMGENAPLCPPLRHLDLGITNSSGSWTGPGGYITTAQSHTGRNSYYLDGTLSLQLDAGAAQPSAGTVLGYDGVGRYVLNNNEMANGFAPIDGKKYVFSCWVKDGSPGTNTLNAVNLTLNGQSHSGTVTVVEGWKKLEMYFDAGSVFNLSIQAAGAYIDDIRIHPFDGQMASYVYDNKSLRLMAQLDENNFATYYEYDDEGTPVRVKKETERGVMTISESRQSLRKRF